MSSSKSEQRFLEAVEKAESKSKSLGHHLRAGVVSWSWGAGCDLYRAICPRCGGGLTVLFGGFSHGVALETDCPGADR